jgi:hypothetical protein
VKRSVKGGDFWITTYQKVTDKYAPYVFYIESDGDAFYVLNKHKFVSDDPTPKNPGFLKLATLDTRPNVVYIARPCQYTSKNLNPKCQNKAYWTNLRMSGEVVDSINQVINSLNNGNRYSLVGYSGGGGIAVLCAARSDKVKDILTLAANLDIFSFMQHHGTSEVAMIGSLNPIDYASKIRNIPQMHISGGRDKIVPPFIADNFVKASSSRCVHQNIFDQNAHGSGWQHDWNYILNLPIACSN